MSRCSTIIFSNNIIRSSVVHSLPDSPLSLISPLTLSNHLRLGLLRLPCRPLHPISTPSCSSCCGKPSTTLSLQQSRCKIYDGTCQTEYQIHIRERRVHKSFHRNYRKPLHVCPIICHARKACSRHASSH